MKETWKFMGRKWIAGRWMLAWGEVGGQMRIWACDEESFWGGKVA